MSLVINFIIGWPLALSIRILNFSAKGGMKRLLGVVVCAALGSLSLGYGYILVFAYPVAGFTAIAFGIVIGVAGTIRSLTNKNEIDEIDWEEGFTELIRGLFDIFLPQRGK